MDQFCEDSETQFPHNIYRPNKQNYFCNQGPILQNWFYHNTTAVTLRLDFDPWFEFVLVTLHYQFEVLIMLALLRLQISTVLTSLSPSNNASKSSHRLCYCKISFIVLVPEIRLVRHQGQRRPQERGADGRHATGHDLQRCPSTRWTVCLCPRRLQVDGVGRCKKAY